jgi:hypothetical protein
MSLAIADEVDAQLTQSMDSYTKLMRNSWRPSFRTVLAFLMQ